MPLLQRRAVREQQLEDAQMSAAAPGRATLTSRLGTVSGGAALPAVFQARMDRAFDADFSNVRVVQDGSAEAMGAQAFASGTTLSFAAGRYDPDSEAGQALIAHELSHVVQQQRGRVGGEGLVVDHGLEAEADDHGARAARGEIIGGGGGRGGASAGPVQASGLDPAAPAAPASRVIAGGGGYQYQQFADGTIKILTGPRGAGRTLPPGDPINKAITTEIEKTDGPFPVAAPAPAAPTPAPAPATSRSIPALETIVTLATDAIDEAASLISGFFSSDDPPATAAAATPAAPSAAAPAATPGAAPTAAAKPIDPANHQSLDTFIKGLPEASLANPLTKGLVAALWPYFKQRDKVVGGFLNVFQQFWKVNWHWEGAVKVCDLAQTVDIDDASKKAFADCAAQLRACAPNPDSGRHPNDMFTIGDSTAGEDSQTWTDAFRTRFNTLKSVKSTLSSLVPKSGLMDKVNKTQADWALRAGQTVAEPEGAGSDPSKQTHHGRGYALDIEGDNAEIAATAKKVGATMTFNEMTHVHCEFPNGVTAPTSK